MSGSALPDVFGAGYSTPIANCFASAEDIVMIFGEDFLRSYLTDLEAEGLTNGLDFAVTEAHQTVLSMLLHRHSEEELRNSSWVRFREARIAGYYLAMRRGQHVPEGIQQAYLLAINDLESIANDTRRIIPGVPTRHQPGPNVSNYEIDNRFLQNRQRRISSQSTSDHDEAKRSIDDANFDTTIP